MPLYVFIPPILITIKFLFMSLKIITIRYCLKKNEKKDFWHAVLKSHSMGRDLKLGHSSFLPSTYTYIPNYLTRPNDLGYPITCAFLFYLLHAVHLPNKAAVDLVGEWLSYKWGSPPRAFERTGAARHEFITRARWFFGASSSFIFCYRSIKLC